MGFGAISTGLSGMYAARRGLDVTGHNVANAGTEGYSRQRTIQVGVGGSPVPAFFSTSSGIGSGVAGEGVDRVRDQFLEARSHSEHGVMAALDQHTATISDVETTFGEPGADGLQSLFSELWSSFDDVVSRPGDLSARTQVLERAQSVAVGIRQAAGNLSTLQSNAVEEVGAQVGEVNETAARIAQLNDAIRAGVNGALSPNDLMDQRDLLVSKLADRVGATAQPGESGMVDVYVGGTALVRGLHTAELGVAATPAGGAAVIWKVGGSDAIVTKGSIGGLLMGANVTIPGYATALDDVAQRLTDTANGLHASGFDLSGAPGGPLFTTTPGRAAATISLSSDLVGHPERLAASGAASPSGNLDAGVAQQLAEAGKLATAPDGAYRTMVNRLGIEGQSATRLSAVQSKIAGSIDAARESQSGVNIDEEMAQMIVYQHAYDAAAKYVSAIDQTLDTLINVVGSR